MFFQSCLLGFSDEDSYDFDNDDDNGSSCKVRSVLKMDPSTGALRIPSYTKFSRADHCPLLKHAWAQDWEQVLKICSNQPWRSLHMTKYSGRTALHLATFDRRCPLAVASALLKANRHMIAVRDSNNYTPLHIVAFFSAATVIGQGDTMVASSNDAETSTENVIAANQMGRNVEDTSGNADRTQSIETSRSTATNIVDAEREATNVVSLFCDTAIMVEQELGRARGKDQEKQEELPLFEGTSPLYLAAKKGASLSILKTLLETRSRTHWIAPSTGGEPYWYESPRGTARIEFPYSPSFSSPLEILLREDRLRSSMNASYYRNDAFLLGEEEDGNLLRRGRPQTNQHRVSSSSAAASRICNGATRARRSPLHPDEIVGNPHLIEAMRRIAINRCHEHYEFQRECSKENGSLGFDCSKTEFHEFTESQQRCLELWEKCIELLVTAGGGGIPMLLNENEDADGKDSEVSTSFTPYGILHACVCCKVPVPSLVEIALLVFPEQVSKRDAICGMIPLHHVLRAKHKYSYATFNLLAILLQGRSSSTARQKKPPSAAKSHIRQESSNASRQTISRGYNMPKAPSLFQSATCADRICEMNGTSSLARSIAEHLKSTVLLPFPHARNDSLPINSIKNQPMKHNNGPVPLVYAIRLGLPMKGVIDKLLEADSHDSLRMIDPISRLPPFALVAIRVCPVENLPDQDYDASPRVYQSLNSNNMHGLQVPTTSTPPSGRSDNSRDIITMAIGSTINILSSGEGNDLTAANTTCTASHGNACSAQSTPKHHCTQYTYQVDDIYSLLRAHPQVLSQYIVD